MKTLKKPIFTFLFLLTVSLTNADGPGYRSVIIDIDGGLDDIRALTLILNHPTLEIKGIVLTDGILTIEQQQQLLSHISNCQINQIPVFRGADLKKKPDFKSPIVPFLPTSKVQLSTRSLADYLKSEPDHSVTWISLGPKTTLSDLLERHPDLMIKIEDIVVSGSPFSNPEKDFNAQLDMKSASFLKSVNPHKIEITPLLPLLGQSKEKMEAYLSDPVNPYLKDWSPVFLNADIRAHQIDNDIFSDEWVGIWLWHSTIFNLDSTGTLFTSTGVDPLSLDQFYFDWIRSEIPLIPRPNVVLQNFPSQPDQFRADVAPFVESIIEKFGYEEYKAVMLTNELHRHLGIYSIIGAKMGIKARELFNADLDELKVISYSGYETPLSCLCDGLQVSTGASLGRGTIQVNTEATYPAAEFTMDGMTYHLKVKPEIVEHIKADVITATQKFGYGSHDYFDEIRRLAILYWADLDRNEIFLINRKY